MPAQHHMVHKPIQTMLDQNAVSSYLLMSSFACKRVKRG